MQQWLRNCAPDATSKSHEGTTLGSTLLRTQSVAGGRLEVSFAGSATARLAGSGTPPQQINLIFLHYTLRVGGTMARYGPAITPPSPACKFASIQTVT